MLRQLIAEYRKKIDRYESMISEWEQELSSGGAGIAIKQDTKTDDEDGSSDSLKNGGNIISSIQDWQFFNKSQPEAARLLLEIAKRPMKTEDIIACLEKGGIKFKSKDEKSRKTTFYTILKRQEEFATIAPNTWALTSWPGVKKKTTDADTDAEDTKAGSQDA